MEDRLLRLLDNEQLSSSKFADVIGVQRSSVSHILTGRNKPSFDFLQKTLKAFPMLNADWLILGEGEMYEGGHGPGGGSLFDQSPVMKSRVGSGQEVRQPGQQQDRLAAERQVQQGQAVQPGQQQDRLAAERQVQQGQAVQHGKQQDRLAYERQAEQGQAWQPQQPEQQREGPVSKQPGSLEDPQEVPVHGTQGRDGVQGAPLTNNQGVTPTKPVSAERKVSKVILFYSDNSFEAFEQA